METNQPTKTETPSAEVLQSRIAEAKFIIECLAEMSEPIHDLGEGGMSEQEIHGLWMLLDGLLRRVTATLDGREGRSRSDNDRYRPRPE